MTQHSDAPGPYPYADVVLPLAIPLAYTYRIPESLQGAVQEGARVVVPLGRKKLYMGVVWRLHNTTPRSDAVKDIVDVFDVSPIVLPQQRLLWAWMAEYYLCTLGDLLQATLPAGLKMERETHINAVEDPPSPPPELTPEERILLGRIRENGPLRIEELLDGLAEQKGINTLKQLLHYHLIEVKERLSQREKKKLVPYIFISKQYNTQEKLNDAFPLLARAEAQERLLLTFLSMIAEVGKQLSDGLPKADVMKRASTSASVLQGLIEKGIVYIEEIQQSRFGDQSAQVECAHPLSADQRRAFDEIKASMARNRVTLLHGVTGSGKTEIYIQLIEEALSAGKQVLYLLPEIALTEQIISRLKLVFGNRVGVYHSRQNDNERVEVYRAIGGMNDFENAPHFDILLGARSSLFLPFTNLGLVIVDEEHDTSYKQVSPAPRYNGRDVAIMLAQIHHAPVLLGTATPSIESYHNALSGKYGLVRLLTRYGDSKLPHLELLDLRVLRHRNEMLDHFSKPMLVAIRKAIADRGQVIIFQNRRGYASYLECEECGWVPMCPNCDVSLTYHKPSDELRCHYCGHHEPVAKACPACGVVSLLRKGLGTQRIEEELLEQIPEAKIARLDLDTTRIKEGASSIIRDFSQGKLNVLVGTQMVTKGLDFSRVLLVCVLDADAMLRLPDFRASERAFQLLSQVGGRAGRRSIPGKLLVQTSSPENPIFEWVRSNDYEAFYDAIVAERRDTGYPPFVRLIFITLKHPRLNIVTAAANRLADILRTRLGDNLLGPQAPLVAWVAKLYLMQVLIKIPRSHNLKSYKEVINIAVRNVSAQPSFTSVRFVIDVDPL